MRRSDLEFLVFAHGNGKIPFRCTDKGSFYAHYDTRQIPLERSHKCVDSQLVGNLGKAMGS